MNKYTRFLALLMCIPLLLSVFSVVSAAETPAGEKATYVLTYDSDDADIAGPELQYFTPYRVQYRMNGGSKKTMKTCVFSLYNTVDDTVIPVYCSDIDTLAESNFVYRRINLEDSTYAASAAGLIRAIVNQGFYLIPIKGESEAAHAVRVEQEVARLGALVGVEDLTIGEAIAGTQAAVWQATHGTSLTYTDLMYSAYKTDISDTVQHYDICDEERWNGHLVYTGTTGELFDLTDKNDEELGDRIEAVFDYLMALEPMAPQDVIVSSASFTNVEAPVFYKNSDGTIDMTVTVTVNVRMEAGDSLALTASLKNGTYTASAPLSNGSQTITLTFEDLPDAMKREKVLLEITGLQSGSDVYLFDAEGDRGTSQSMVGMADGRLPVYASVTTDRPTEGFIEEDEDPSTPPGTPVVPPDAEQELILSFYKTTVIPNGMDNYDTYPLEGIVFDIYFVATLTDVATGKVVLPDAVDYQYPETPDFTLVTGTDGMATVNLTEEGMPQGVYLVVEREHIAIKAPVDPFYVTMPATTPDGTGHIYDVTVQPKNELKGIVKIEKDVITLGNDSASVNAYSNHTWIIGTNIPEDIAEGKSFVITDSLDSRLDYIGNMKVRVETLDGTTVMVELQEGADYTLAVTDVNSLSPGNPSDSFSMALTKAGMAKVAAAVGENSFDDYMLRVYFDAQINANATLATEIPNEAYLYYTNSVNFDFSSKSDKPVVYTGGANLLKADAADHSKILSGAIFEVYRTATAEEVTAGENLHTVIGFDAPMIKVSFFDNKALAGEKVTTAVSDEDGKIILYGLAYGTYYLREIQAPSGYTLPLEGVKITIDENSHLEDNTIIIENAAGSLLPSTGGIGTEIYTISGLILLCGAALFLLLQKARSSKA